jgi:cobalt-zinc-cadmium efflux system membrane fusion protein
MNCTRILIGAAALALACDAFPEAINISPVELENLGVRFEAPERVTEVPGIEATARVAIPPAGDAIVGTPQSGLLTGVNVSAGDSVDSGQVLAELRSPGFIALQREFLDAFNTYQLARNAFERDRQLHDDGIISARRLQETTTGQRIAEAGVNEHRQLLQIAGLSDAEIRLLERDQRLLETLRIRAPFSGVIVERMATTGQRLDAMSPIYRLADLSELWLEISVPREHVTAISTGMRVIVTEHGSETAATVTTIGRAIDPATQFVVVRARLDGDSHGLSPGQFEAVRIVATQAGSPETGTLAIPAAAVTRSGDSRYVFVRTGDGIEVREVDVVSMYAGRAYVAAGLAADDAVAVTGVSTLKGLWFAQGDSGTQ